MATDIKSKPLTLAADKRIPKKPEGITPENLKHFAEWQRRLDIELNRA